MYKTKNQDVVWIIVISLGTLALLYYFKKQQDISLTKSEKKTDESEPTQSTEDVKKDEKLTWNNVFVQGKIIFENAKSGKTDPKSLSARDRCIATFYQYSLDKKAKFHPEKGTPEEAITKCIESLK